MKSRCFNARSVWGRSLSLLEIPSDAGVPMRTLSLDQSVAMIPDGASLMIGGFMAVGTPERIIGEIVRPDKRDLTVIANDTAMPGKGIVEKDEPMRLKPHARLARGDPF